jgi:hypothetical protein
MGSLLPRSRRASACGWADPGPVSDAGNPLSLRVARPAASFNEGDAAGRQFLRQVPCGLNQESVGWVGVVYGAGQLGPLEVPPSPRGPRRRPGSGYSLEVQRSGFHGVRIEALSMYKVYGSSVSPLE